MTYNVKLETFEGPFDLLYHLIEKAEVDIYDIPIAKITEQYLAYLEEMKKFDLDITSEFLVMAATLLEIKSKMLLPNKTEEQLTIAIDEIDPRQELIARLIEYKKYKNAAIEFKKREDIFKRTFYKPQEQLEPFIVIEDNNVINLDISELINAFNNLLKKKNKQNNTIEHVREIKRDEVTIEEKIVQIRDLLNQKVSLRFEELFSDMVSRSEIIVTFLAMLELMKLKFLVVQQNKIFGEITVRKVHVVNEV
ncbi:MAG: segregation and condensation protein A [Bacillota bacterium]